MYPSVLAAFTPMSKKFEGYLPWMYVDVKGLVTTGMGNLIDPVENALNLPWRHGVGGSLASQTEINTAWHAVKNSNMNNAGGGNQGKLTTLRLDDEGIQQVIHQKLTNNEAILRKRFPKWDSLPAEVQLTILSIAWAAGANFNFPKFIGYINQPVPDFKAAAGESYMTDNPQHNINMPPISNPGLRPRNLANRQLLLNADKAISLGAPLDQLLVPIEGVLAQIGGIVSGVVSLGESTYKAATASAQATVDTVRRNPFTTLGGVAGVGLIFGGLAVLYAERDKL